ncbi:MAG: class I SAM-dependent methyltransferase [Pirellulales bacterium]
MRDSLQQQKADARGPDKGKQTDAVPYDEKNFFESYYKATTRGPITDRDTIGAISQMEARFHYNAVENAILRGLSRRTPPPPQAMVAAWEALSSRHKLRLLDIGSGTGHWIEFMQTAAQVNDVVGVEIAESMYQCLKQNYEGSKRVRILNTDVADPGFGIDNVGGTVDYITAIGVMFHIVDDGRWRQALVNLAHLLNDDGLLIVGGDFGQRTANVQFHCVDSFHNWKEQIAVANGPCRINKRIRSLDDWTVAATSAGLKVVEVVRTERCERLTTPENDVLFLEKI